MPTLLLAQASQVLTPPGTPNPGNVTKNASYGIGYDIGMNISSGGITAEDVQPSELLKGLMDALAGKDPAVEPDVVRSAMEALGKKLLARKLDSNKKFLAENAKQEGVVVTDSGLQYKVLKSGTGATPQANSQVTVHYEGKLLSGQVFDSSLQRGQPATFGVSRVIPGWTEALLRMKVGDKWELVIPSNLAYGEQGSPPVIGPNEVLKFEVELLEVK
jgi:FKBP-type peptidyl-prolyl cis-trans isomerase FklB